MKNKTIFLFLFVPLHFLLTVILLQYYWFNYNPNAAGLWEKSCHYLAFALAVPVLTPFIISDLGEYWPWAIQIFTFIFNSLIWGVCLLVVFAGIRRLRGK
jgi:hypothetical protein